MGSNRKEINFSFDQSSKILQACPGEKNSMDSQQGAIAWSSNVGDILFAKIVGNEALMMTADFPRSVAPDWDPLFDCGDNVRSEYN